MNIANMEFEQINKFSKTIGYICAIVAPILGITFGILALVPAGPFDHKDVTLGVGLIVLSVITFISIAAYAIGYGIGYLLCALVISMCLMYHALYTLLVQCYTCATQRTKPDADFAGMV